MSRFGALKDEVNARAVPAKADKLVTSPGSVHSIEVVATPFSTRAKARIGKKSVTGYFSPEVSKALNQMVLDGEAGSVQALLGEAIDLLMRAKGRHPFGER